MKSDKLLFTPGPLTTSNTVKESMVRDLGSRDIEFINLVAKIRKELLDLAGLSKEEGYDSILMQGSGTFGIESVLSSVISVDGHVLVICNGAYGERMVQITKRYNIKTTQLAYDENVLPDASKVDAILTGDRSITHVAIVHCETTTGIFNNIDEIGEVVNNHGRIYIVDAMSSFGAVPIDFPGSNIHFLISSSNKCIEGVPGFSFVIAEIDELKRTKGSARTISLDLHAQWEGLEGNGQFRFTPPVQSILAFHQALKELKLEGGVEGRTERYQKNHKVLIDGMRRMGFREYIPSDRQGYIITSFLYPDDPNFNFDIFYKKLNEQGLVIYPGKVSKANCFRIGNIGRINTEDIERLLREIENSLVEMLVSIK